ncbi:DUF3298 and DUF4163 domain-containing protein [Sporosarcina sp. G11-34]|uniref:DUF3298 and DUF4163 domain-containing protein n=1 Tax=Sporosarcina sp. G11-34 TaxID=2849605 RepID=UPI0022A8F77E|nr:DUF3298 and DUF4163 domain-containing protein [Sporosarcina sp. G11-34]MCZ2259665.1 DUF3298 and DUF4163 domain-containing protein [Sporosarcina sp. G11-34]
MEFPVSIKTKNIPHASPNVNIFFPVVLNLKNENAQSRINHTIVTLLNKILIEQSYYDPSLVEMQAYYEIKNNQRGILSLNLIVYSFTGGAHGTTIIKSLTFDTASGKSYILSEMFKPGSDYVKVLSAIIQKDIKNWGIDLVDGFNGIDKEQDFYIADTSIVIYFQIYDITPGYWGFPYFPIPLLDISNIIRPNSPLDRMMAFT